MTRLDHGSRLLLARDRIDRFRAEAVVDRLPDTSGRPVIGSWEGRAGHRPTSDRALARIGRAPRRDLRPNPE